MSIIKFILGAIFAVYMLAGAITIYLSIACILFVYVIVRSACKH